MKVTKTQLQEIIKEELENVLNEKKATDTLKDILKKIKDKIAEEFKDHDEEGMKEKDLLKLLSDLEGEMRGDEDEDHKK